MRLLIDECVPKRFARLLLGHEVRTIAQQGWAGKKNGELLRLIAENSFDAFITVDQNLNYQQNLVGYRVGIIVLAAQTNRLIDMEPLAPQVLNCLPLLKLGDVKIISLNKVSHG